MFEQKPLGAPTGEIRGRHVFDAVSPDQSNMFESEYALSETFDFNCDAKLRQKYIILSNPRTGSTMVSSALYATNLAGAPFEYFHRELLNACNKPETRPNELNLYLDGIIRRRTSPNGYFGMKMHFVQFDYLFGRNSALMSIGLKFLSEFDKRILIYRRDKILQGISGLLAKENQAWSSTDGSKTSLLGRAPKPNDVVEISEYVRTFVAWDQAWRELISRIGGSSLEVAYEDLCKNPDDEFNRIFEYLGLDELRGRRTEFVTAKQTDIALTGELKRAYLESIGAFESSGADATTENVSG